MSRARQRSATFEDLYDSLATRWSRHQDLRLNASTSFQDLAVSSAQVDEARGAMWEWWKNHRIQEIR